MNTRIHKLHAVPGPGAQSSAPEPVVSRRDVSVAVIVVAVLLGDAALGGLVSSRSGSDVTQKTATAPEPPVEFVYFPSQYVNQATEPEEHIQAF